MYLMYLIDQAARGGTYPRQVWWQLQRCTKTARERGGEVGWRSQV